MTANNHWDTSTLEGRGYGQNLADVCYQGLCGTFTTRPITDIYPSATNPGFTALSADAVGQGAGDFAGMTIFEHADCDWGSVTLPLPYPPVDVFTVVCEYTGEILDPSGTLQP